MKIMCVWTKNEEDNFMKIVRSKSEMNNARVSGRKPDKIVTRAADLKPMTIKELKRHISYDGTIVVDTSVVYSTKLGIK